MEIRSLVGQTLAAGYFEITDMSAMTTETILYNIPLKPGGTVELECRLVGSEIPHVFVGVSADRLEIKKTPDATKYEYKIEVSLGGQIKVTPWSPLETILEQDKQLLGIRWERAWHFKTNRKDRFLTVTLLRKCLPGLIWNRNIEPEPIAMSVVDLLSTQMGAERLVGGDIALFPLTDGHCNLEGHPIAWLLSHIQLFDDECDVASLMDGGEGEEAKRYKVYVETDPIGGPCIGLDVWETVSSEDETEQRDMGPVISILRELENTRISLERLRHQISVTEAYTQFADAQDSVERLETIKAEFLECQQKFIEAQERVEATVSLLKIENVDGEAVAAPILASLEKLCSRTNKIIAPKNDALILDLAHFDINRVSNYTKSITQLWELNQKCNEALLSEVQFTKLQIRTWNTVSHRTTRRVRHLRLREMLIQYRKIRARAKKLDQLRANAINHRTNCTKVVEELSTNLSDHSGRVRMGYTQQLQRAVVASCTDTAMTLAICRKTRAELKSVLERREKERQRKRDKFAKKVEERQLDAALDIVLKQVIEDSERPAAANRMQQRRQFLDVLTAASWVNPPLARHPETDELHFNLLGKNFTAPPVVSFYSVASAINEGGGYLGENGFNDNTLEGKLIQLATTKNRFGLPESLAEHMLQHSKTTTDRKGLMSLATAFVQGENLETLNSALAQIRRRSELFRQLEERIREELILRPKGADNGEGRSRVEFHPTEPPSVSQEESSTDDFSKDSNGGIPSPNQSRTPEESQASPTVNFQQEEGLNDLLEFRQKAQLLEEAIERTRVRIIPSIHMLHNIGIRSSSAEKNSLANQRSIKSTLETLDSKGKEPKKLPKQQSHVPSSPAPVVVLQHGESEILPENITPDAIQNLMQKKSAENQSLDSARAAFCPFDHPNVTQSLKTVMDRVYTCGGRLLRPNAESLELLEPEVESTKNESELVIMWSPEIELGSGKYLPTADHTPFKESKYESKAFSLKSLFSGCTQKLYSRTRRQSSGYSSPMMNNKSPLPDETIPVSKTPIPLNTLESLIPTSVPREKTFTLAEEWKYSPSPSACRQPTLF